MFSKRPNKSEKDENIMKMHQEFLVAKGGGASEVESLIEKAPLDKPNARVVKVKKKSLYAQRHGSTSQDGASNVSIKPIWDTMNDRDMYNGDSYKGYYENQIYDGSDKCPVKDYGDDLFEQFVATKSAQELLQMRKFYMDKMGPEKTAFLMNRNKVTSVELDSHSKQKIITKTNCQMKKENEVQGTKFMNEESLKIQSSEVLVPADRLPSLITRFGLRGEIMFDDHLKSELYHHDEEPERAGYTIQELLLFVRSAFNQQQTFGLKTLSCIVKQAKLGSYYGQISKSIIPVLVDAGAAVLARSSLDSPARTVIMSSVEFLHALLVNPEDETAIDHTFTWFRGHEQPVMNASEELFDNYEAVETLSDENVIKVDLIEGLKKMDLIGRISYLIKLLHCETSVVDNMLDIIIRICRCYKSQIITGSNHHLENIVMELLPISNDSSSLTHYRVIKIIRLLASSDITVAKDLLDKYSGNIFQYFYEEAPRNSYLESLRFLIVLLRYRLAFDIFQNKIRFVTTRLCSIFDLMSKDLLLKDQDSYEISLLLCLVEAGLDCLNEHKMSPITTAQEWSKLVSLCIDVCKFCVNEFISKYHLQIHSVSEANPTSIVGIMKECVKSVSFERAVTFLRENSVIINNANLESLGESCASFKTLESLWADPSFIPRSKEGPPTMPKLLEVHHMNLVFPIRPSSPLKISDHLDIKWHPVLHPLSTSSFLVAMARMVITLSKKNLCREIPRNFLSHPEIHLYLSKTLCSQTSALSQNWFSRYETHFLYFLVKMANQLIYFAKQKSNFNTVFYHNVALNLMVKLLQGDEAFAIEIIRDVIFNQEYFRDALPDEKFEDRFVFHTKRSPSINFAEDILMNLSNMSDAYIKLFFNEESIINSGDSFKGSYNRVKCMMVGRNKAIFPTDWLFQPLHHLYLIYNQSKIKDEIKSKQFYEILKPLIELCKHSIRAIFLFEKTRAFIFESVSPLLKLSRFMQAIIVAAREFEEDVTYSYLDQIMEAYGKHNKKSKIPHQTLSNQLYQSFLDEYVQCFGGIPVYEVLVLMPLVLFDDSNSLWDMFWTSSSGASRYLALPLSQFPYDVSHLLKKPADGNLIELFLYFVKMNLFTHAKTPIPYLIAIHNLNYFLFFSGKLNQRNEKNVENLRHIIITKPSRTHILLYKCFNIRCDMGFELYESLPPLRQKRFDEMIGTFTAAATNLH